MRTPAFHSSKALHSSTRFARGLVAFSVSFVLCGLAFGAAPISVKVGPGYTDVSPHQLVRTSGNFVYVITPTGMAYRSNTTATLVVSKGNVVGIPTAYAAQDVVHSPGTAKTGITTTAGVSSSASAIDGTDVIHSVWIDNQGNTKGVSGDVYYAQFSTKTGKWGPATLLDGATGWTGYVVGDQGVNIALDKNGAPHVCWTAKVSGKLRIKYSNRTGATWSKPVLADETAVTAINAWHPTLAFAPNGDLLLAYVDGLGGYSHDGAIRTRLRHASGTWAATITIPIGNVYTGIDNGPSLMITADGRQHIAFTGTVSDIQYWYNAGSGWVSDEPLTKGMPQISHDPSLGPDGTANGIYIYGHGTPVPVRGIGPNLYRFHKPAGGVWGPWIEIVPDPHTPTANHVDCAVSTRWSQFFFNSPTTVDFGYYSELTPNSHDFTVYTGTH